ncbi:MAG: hypothetical protein JL50_11370 [Peptococcaceae bacterium BICA1-7]|nr:MAG: hypothetical protein JL50_11370 [Peptococcaceae bacterium BICA1-7]
MVLEGKMVSVVSPVYNEEARVGEFIKRTSATLENVCSSYEIILVDDCSTDGTLGIISEAARKDGKILGIHLVRNSGQHLATLVGLKHARGQIIVTVDSDLQVNPEDIAVLINTLDRYPEYSIISGQRTSRTPGMLRNVGSNIVSMLLNVICSTKLKDMGSTFKAMRKPVLDFALQNEILAQNMPLFVAYTGFKIHEVPIYYHPVGKRSSYGFSSLILILSLAIINFSSGARLLSILLMSGLFLAITGTSLLTGLIIHGMVFKVPLRTNLLLASVIGMLTGWQFIGITLLGFKLETVIRNLKLKNTPVIVKITSEDLNHDC